MKIEIKAHYSEGIRTHSGVYVDDKCRGIEIDLEASAGFPRYTYYYALSPRHTYYSAFMDSNTIVHKEENYHWPVDEMDVAFFPTFKTLGGLVDYLTK